MLNRGNAFDSVYSGMSAITDQQLFCLRKLRDPGIEPVSKAVGIFSSSVLNMSDELSKRLP